MTHSPVVEHNPKYYLLDTNVLLGDPRALFSFQENHIIIPMIVLEELDRFKSHNDEIGRAARTVNRTLDELRSTGSLHDGVPLPGGGTLRVISSEPTPIKGLNYSKPDNLIIGYASLDPKYILVSRDISVRIKCDALNIRAEDYLNQRVQDTEGGYTGVSVLHTDRVYIDNLYHNTSLVGDEVRDALEAAGHPELSSNEILVLKDGSPVSSISALCRYIITDAGDPEIRLLTREGPVFGVTPKNKEQRFALELLLDPTISLVTITGSAGCGKTFISIAAAFEQLNGFGTQQRYEKFIVARPNYSMGPDLGYLPGTLEEKLHPWIAPIRDNIAMLLNKKNKGKSEAMLSNDAYLTTLQEKGVIEVQALSYIRGRSISDAILLIDESQNLSKHELKTIITRAGENCKIILTGDTSQIDNPHLDALNNGLSHCVEAFKRENIAGHITLIKGERSRLSATAARVLLSEHTCRYGYYRQEESSC